MINQMVKSVHEIAEYTKLQMPEKCDIRQHFSPGYAG